MSGSSDEALPDFGGAMVAALAILPSGDGVDGEMTITLQSMLTQVYGLVEATSSMLDEG